MSHYVPNIDFFINGLPIVIPMYSCSEGFFGINLNPLTKPHEVSYTLIPTMEDHQKLVDLVEVELGREYELVVTNYAVAGFQKNAPHFNFMRRINVVLSIDKDKTDETELQNAVKKEADYLMISSNVSLTEYTSFDDTSTDPGHYVLYWELQMNNINVVIPHTVFEECSLVMEESLGYQYRYERIKWKSVGPLEIKIVETGTFGKLMDHAINQGSSVTQYKTPRCLKLGSMLELLNSMVLSSSFSPRFPHL
ncbi:hypothetical protein MKX03_020318 [Papaver bracteatum]|nr:hypothetical protein MKX03_020318 [Papaver bracteatum]